MEKQSEAQVLGKNLKKLRNAAGFTAEQLAHAIGITRSAYANYEAGIRTMPILEIEKAADALGVEALALVEGKENVVDDMLVCAFRIDNMSDGDVDAIVAFKRMVKNYLKMERICARQD